MRNGRGEGGASGGICQFATASPELEVAEELGAKGCARGGILKQIGSVDKAFGAIVPWNGTEVPTEEERSNEGVRPSSGPIMEGDELLPVMQVFERCGCIGFGEPVGDKKGEVVVAIAQSAV